MGRLVHQPAGGQAVQRGRDLFGRLSGRARLRHGEQGTAHDYEEIQYLSGETFGEPLHHRGGGLWSRCRREFAGHLALQRLEVRQGAGSPEQPGRQTLVGSADPPRRGCGLCTAGRGIPMPTGADGWREDHAADPLVAAGKPVSVPPGLEGGGDVVLGTAVGQDGKELGVAHRIVIDALRHDGAFVGGPPAGVRRRGLFVATLELGRAHDEHGVGLFDAAEHPGLPALGRRAIDIGMVGEDTASVPAEPLGQCRDRHS